MMNNDKHASIKGAVRTSSLMEITVPTTKILAVGHWIGKGITPEERLPVLPHEVPSTVRIYLNGKIDQWYFKTDHSGVVFILNVTNTEEARELLEELPLGKAGMMSFDYIPLGPLSPLQFLLKPVHS